MESYPLGSDGMTKHCRSINAYSDEIKAVLGPKIQQIEKAILYYSPLSPFFVKSVPVLDRPALLESIFGSEQCVIGDFSAFECMHRGPLAQAVYDVFAHVGRFILNQQDLKLLRTLICEHNHSYFPAVGLHVWIRGTLMSGAPWTSLANCMLSLTLVLWLRLTERNGIARVSDVFTVRAVAEGDDTITAGGPYDEGLIRLLGLGATTQQKERLKSNVLPSFKQGDFCGITMSEEGYLFTDPVKVISNFFSVDFRRYGSRQTLLWGLYRAKALSLYYQYRTCPMVSVFCFQILTETRRFRAISSELSYHQQECFEQAQGGQFHKHLDDMWTNGKYPMSARLQFESLYGVTPDDQIRFEQSVLSGGKLWFPDNFEGLFQYTCLMSSPLTSEFRRRGEDELLFRGLNLTGTLLDHAGKHLSLLDLLNGNAVEVTPQTHPWIQDRVLANPRAYDDVYGDPNTD